MASKSYDYLFKIILIGDSDAGKTSLLCHYTEDFPDRFSTLIGFDFKNKNIILDEKRIRLQIWDTNGFGTRAITASFFKGTLGMLLLYNVSNRLSFNNILKWLPTIRQYANKDVVIMLVGNYVDPEKTKVVEAEEAQKFAEEHNILFIETCVKNMINVNEVFELTAKRIYENEGRTEVEHNANGIRLESRDHNNHAGVKSSCF